MLKKKNKTKKIYKSYKKNHQVKVLCEEGFSKTPPFVFKLNDFKKNYKS